MENNGLARSIQFRTVISSNMEGRSTLNACCGSCNLAELEITALKDDEKRETLYFGERERVSFC